MQQPHLSIESSLQIIENLSFTAIPDNFLDVLKTLYDHECYDPILDVFGHEDILSKIEPDQASSFLSIYIQIILSDFEQEHVAGETLSRWVEKFNFGFAEILALFNSEKFNNAKLLIKILKSIWGHFKTSEDKILCLEYLGNLQNSVFGNTKDTVQTYETLCKIAPNHWGSISLLAKSYKDHEHTTNLVILLTSLLPKLEDPKKRAIIAADLAWVSLHELSDPMHALKLIADYCPATILDMKQATYDCLLETKNWVEVTRFLQEELLSATEEQQRAVIHFMLGRFAMKEGKKDGAIKAFLEAHACDASYLPAIEQLIILGDKHKLWLGVLRDTVKTPKNRAKLQFLFEASGMPRPLARQGA